MSLARIFNFINGSLHREVGQKVDQVFSWQHNKQNAQIVCCSILVSTAKFILLVSEFKYKQAIQSNSLILNAILVLTNLITTMLFNYTENRLQSQLTQNLQNTIKSEVLIC
jgi:hypothetical protein